MIVLKIIGYIILGIIALIIIALCIKVKIEAEYSDNNTFIELQWLFIKIPIFPKSEKIKKDNTKENDDIPEEVPEQEPKEESEELSESEQNDENNIPKKKKNNFLKIIYESHGIDGLLLIFKRIFSYIGSFVGDIMKCITIDELYLDVLCTKDDAASTAIYYGEICSFLYPILGALISKYKVKKYEIDIYPDFIARYCNASFAVKFHFYPIYLINVTILFILRFIFKVVIRFIVKIFLSLNIKKTEN